MNDFEKRIRIKLGNKKHEESSILGASKLEKECGLNPKMLKQSVLATDFKKRGGGGRE